MTKRRWLVLSAPTPPPGEEHLMVGALHRLGARAVAREGERVVAWLPEPADVDARVREAEAALRASTSLADPALAWRRRSHREWEARWGGPAEPRRVGERIVVAPPGADVPGGRDDVVIRLEPGVAFGSAEHPTTRGCLRLLEALSAPGDRVADIGAGSGVLAIAAALMGAKTVRAWEADPLACAGARRNLALNGVADRVDVRERTVRPAHLRRLRRQDVILANLEAGTITALVPAFSRALAPGGWLIVAGVTGGERKALLDVAATAGLEVGRQEDVEGWWCAAFRRRR